MKKYLNQKQITDLSKYDIVFDDVVVATDLIELLPREIKSVEDNLLFELEIWPTKDENDKEFWIVAYIPDDNSDCEYELNYECAEELIDALYDMVLWTNKNGYKR